MKTSLLVVVLAFAQSVMAGVDFENPVFREACVGDSITAGTSEYNYPKYLAEYLKAFGAKTGVRYEVKNHGKGAASVRHVREKVDVNGCAHQVQSSNSSRRARRIVV